MQLTESKLLRYGNNDLDAGLLFNDGRGVGIEVIYSNFISDEIPNLTYADYCNLHGDIRNAMVLYKDYTELYFNNQDVWAILISNEMFLLKDYNAKPYFEDDAIYKITVNEYRRFFAEYEKDKLELALPTHGEKSRKIIKI